LAGGEDELISALKIAKVRIPESIDRSIQARQTEVRQHVAQGAEFFHANRYADAETEFRTAIRLDPESAESHAILGVTLGQKRRSEGSDCRVPRVPAPEPDR
jgi:Tfp pilus assembly protein PilF